MKMWFVEINFKGVGSKGDVKYVWRCSGEVRHHGAVSIWSRDLTCVGIPIIKIRRSHDLLIIIMEILYSETLLDIETGPRLSTNTWLSLSLTHSGPVTLIYVSELCSHWFMLWLGTCSVPSHYTNHYWQIGLSGIYLSEILFEIQISS